MARVRANPGGRKRKSRRIIGASRYSGAVNESLGFSAPPKSRGNKPRGTIRLSEGTGRNNPQLIAKRKRQQAERKKQSGLSSGGRRKVDPRRRIHKAVRKELTKKVNRAVARPMRKKVSKVTRKEFGQGQRGRTDRR